MNCYIINNMSFYKMFKNKKDSSKFVENIKEGIKEIEEGKCTKYEGQEELFKDIHEDEKKHPIYYMIYGWYWRVYYIITGIPLQIRTFFQRGKKGIAESDIWNLHDYLSKVTIEGLKYIKEYGIGVPTWEEGMKEGEATKKWHEILDTLIWTFEIAQKISDGNVYYLRNVKDRKSWREVCKKLNKKHPEYENRVMTDKEIRKYDKGWRLFKKYYYSLWD